MVRPVADRRRFWRARFCRPASSRPRRWVPDRLYRRQRLLRDRGHQARPLVVQLASRCLPVYLPSPLPAKGSIPVRASALLHVLKCRKPKPGNFQMSQGVCSPAASARSFFTRTVMSTGCVDDRRYPPRAVQGFLTKDELQLAIQRRTARKALAGEEIDPADRWERFYQSRAIRRVAEFPGKRAVYARRCWSWRPARAKRALSLL